MKENLGALRLRLFWKLERETEPERRQLLTLCRAEARHPEPMPDRAPTSKPECRSAWRAACLAHREKRPANSDFGKVRRHVHRIDLATPQKRFLMAISRSCRA